MSTPPRKIFGTDGVRGVANVEPVTAETALKLGRAAAHVITRLSGRRRREGARPKIVIGKDTRVSGYMLETALVAGITSLGVDVLVIGPLPTPGVAYITRSLRADAGIVLSASHNPYEDNGIKFFRHDGYKLDDAIEAEIEDLVFSGAIEAIRPTADNIGQATRIDDALGRYIEFAKASFPRGLTLDGLSIAVDCANGAAYKSTPCILRELGADIHVAHNAPNGRNINARCGSTHPEEIARLVCETGASIGISHDGDADRVGGLVHQGLLGAQRGLLGRGQRALRVAGSGRWPSRPAPRRLGVHSGSLTCANRRLPWRCSWHLARRLLGGAAGQRLCQHSSGRHRLARPCGPLGPRPARQCRG